MQVAVGVADSKHGVARCQGFGFHPTAVVVAWSQPLWIRTEGRRGGSQKTGENAIRQPTNKHKSSPVTGLTGFFFFFFFLLLCIKRNWTWRMEVIKTFPALVFYWKRSQTGKFIVIILDFFYSHYEGRSNHLTTGWASLYIKKEDVRVIMWWKCFASQFDLVRSPRTYRPVAGTHPGSPPQPVGQSGSSHSTWPAPPPPLPKGQKSGGADPEPGRPGPQLGRERSPWPQVPQHTPERNAGSKKKKVLDGGLV